MLWQLDLFIRVYPQHGRPSLCLSWHSWPLEPLKISQRQFSCRALMRVTHESHRSELRLKSLTLQSFPQFAQVCCASSWLKSPGFW